MEKITPFLKLIRPIHWAKNIFVFTGIIFGEAQGDPLILLHVVFAAVSFSFAASAIYVINDIADVEQDRLHPQKKKRPIASGKISPSSAMALALGCAAAALIFGYFASLTVLLIIAIYALINIAYSLRLKQIVILDVFCIASGFMLRILAGTVGVGIPPSKWLLLCGLMITLFLGFAKRRAELIALKGDEKNRRSVLYDYGPVLLDEITAICATGVIICYSLYTMSPDTIRVHQTEDLIYTVPFVIYALFRYLYILHHNQKAEDPATDLFKDPHIIFSVAGWTLLTVCLIL